MSLFVGGSVEDDWAGREKKTSCEPLFPRKKGKSGRKKLAQFS